MLKQEYFKYPAISNSQLGDFKQSPMHYLYRRDNPQPDTKATLIGSAFHYLVFEPGNLGKYMFVLQEEKRPVPGKDYRTKENAEWKAGHKLRCDALGIEMISSDDFGIAQDMYDALMSDPFAKDLIKAKLNQFEKFDTWEWDGIKFKRKVDIWNPDFIGDLKSCESADFAGFERSIFSWDYYRQGGMYTDGDRILDGSDFFKDFYLIAVEKSAPYGVSVHMLSPDVLQYGCDEYRKLAKQLVECQKKNDFPGYYSKKSGGINNVYLPNYLKNE